MDLPRLSAFDTPHVHLRHRRCGNTAREWTPELLKRLRHPRRADHVHADTAGRLERRRAAKAFEKQG